ncbi:galactokinase [Salinispirillum sp. LH 10-3-1]|uniref:Galactokinase n=1 Tax=Salinispirillum sp. LH 10-3-1 TaxID=2952525 RepID=A0AB38YEQ8_9GAMM
MTLLSNQTVAERFQQAFGVVAEVIVHAPGRVNVIGEHTDYNLGFVLPAAIDYGTWIAARTLSGRALEVVAHDFGHQRVCVALDDTPERDKEAPWSDYVRGVVAQLRQRGFQLAGAQLLVTGNVPSGAGLSSSASFEIALIRALLAISGEQITPQEAAKVGQAAENEFVGISCGIMDQMVSALGQHNSALLIDCADLSATPVAMPADWGLLIVHSGVRRGLVESAYNQRRQECESVAAYFGQPSLRDVSLAQLLAAEAHLPANEFRRARHVLTENARTLTAADALKTGDLPTLVQVMAESHDSMRDDFAITTPAIDQLVSLMQSAAAGRAGVRMTGGGFGGCVVALGQRACLSELAAAVERDYQTRTGNTPTLIPAVASAGAFSLDPVVVSTTELERKQAK